MFATMIIGLLLTGLIVGGLGRLVIPGPNPMTLGMTILVGIGGAFLGGLVGSILFGAPGGIVLAVPCAAVIVWWIDRGRAARLDRWD